VCLASPLLLSLCSPPSCLQHRATDCWGSRGCVAATTWVDVLSSVRDDDLRTGVPASSPGVGSCLLLDVFATPRTLNCVDKSH
jgi:hypothetical protein